MALPTKTDVVTLDWTKDGLPWCKVPARSDIDPTTMDWVRDGLPWVVGLESEEGLAARLINNQPIFSLLKGFVGSLILLFKGW